MINKIFLSLGGACNYNCRHCLQIPNPPIESFISESAIKYLNSVIEQRANKEKLYIVFWGGEPLLYLDTIKCVIDMFGDKLSYGVVTNGSLIDESFVNYANKYNIAVTLSNDGLLTGKVRDTNLLEDDQFVEMFNKLKKKSIESVATAYTYDYLALFKYLDSKVPNVYVTVDLLRLTWRMPSDLYSFDFKKYEDALKEVALVALDDIKNGKQTNATNVFNRAYLRLKENNNDNSFANCRQIITNFNMDLAGNVYICPNSSVVLGTVNDDDNTLINKYKSWYATTIKSECTKCPMYIMCNGGCPLEDRNLQDIQCKIYKTFYGVVKWMLEKVGE